jgi:hypothetical protein
MANITSGDDRQPILRKRMTRSVGLVLVGTAALMLGMPGGCDDHGSGSSNSNANPNSYGQGYSSTQPSRHPSSSSHHYYTSGRRSTSGGWWSSSHSGGGSSSGSHSSSGASSHTSRGGFGSTGHHDAS